MRRRIVLSHLHPPGAAPRCTVTRGSSSAPLSDFPCLSKMDHHVNRPPSNSRPNWQDQHRRGDVQAHRPVGPISSAFCRPRSIAGMIAIKPAALKRSKTNRPSRPEFWNRIPDDVRQRIVEMVLDEPELSPRELAAHFTDTQNYFVSEASVYRPTTSSPAQPDRHQSGGRVQGQDDRHQSALADRLHILQGYGSISRLSSTTSRTARASFSTAIRSPPPRARDCP